MSSKKVYLDTGALIAFLDGSDSYHALFANLFAKAPPMLTSPLVIAEGHGWFLKRYDEHRGAQFLAFIESLKSLTVAPLSSQELSEASKRIRQYLDQRLTLADALGLHLMRTHKIRSCWGTDRHLTLEGASLVIHASGNAF